MPPETISLVEAPPYALNGPWIEVRLDCLLKNLSRIREKVGPTVGVMAVVKANAYGHGLAAVAKALEGKVEFLGLHSVREGSVLREQGIQTPLLVFGRALAEEIPVALQMKLGLTLSSFEEAREISEQALRTHETATVHLKVDTGMGRLGIPYARAHSEIERIAKLPALAREGIYTHLATAEKVEDPFAEKQLTDFDKLLADLEAKGISFAYRHAANSAATFRFNSPRLNLVRPGLALYGIYPAPCFETMVRLEPVLSLKSRIVFLKRLAPGDSVSYGREFVAQSPTTIAVIPVGYSHGYPFQLSGVGEILHRGRRFRIAGRVCMDSMMVNLGPEPEARVGDEVTILGTEGKETLRAEELASRAQTISYEVVTRLDPGLPRFYRL